VVWPIFVEQLNISKRNPKVVCLSDNFAELFAFRVVQHLALYILAETLVDRVKWTEVFNVKNYTAVRTLRKRVDYEG